MHAPRLLKIIGEIMSALVTVIGVIAAAGTLTIFLASRPARIALYASPFVAIVFGFLFVAPALLHAHHLAPTTLAEWRTIVAWLLIAFAVIGLIVSLLPALILGVLDIALRRDSRDDAIVPVLWCMSWLPAMYLTASSLVEWINFSRPPATAPRTLMLWSIAFAIALGGVALTARRRSHRTYGFSRSAGWLGVAVLAAICSLPLQVRVSESTADIKDPPLTARDSAHRPPLLFIGLDGGDWRLLRPAIESGRAPHLASLFASGIHGTVKAQWPPYWSTPAWGAILTGHDIQEIGVHEDLAATANGLPPFELPLTLDPLLNPMFVPEFMLIQQDVIEPTPVPRSRLKRAPVWERLTAAGRKTAVVRLPFSYPAPGQASYVVSNRIVTDLWEQLGVKAGERSLLVAPRAESDRLMSRFSSAPISDGGELAYLRGGARLRRPADSLVDLEQVLEKVFDIEERMVTTAEDLVEEHPTLDVMMIHINSLDAICHAFWQYRFPDDFPGRDRPTEADIRTMGPVVDRYVEYIDSQVGRLIAAFPAEPNVVIVSDHGAEASHDYPLWKGWHGPEGVFIAAGPDIRSSPIPSPVSYLDIAPTILELQGFDVPPDLTGRPLAGGGHAESTQNGF
jgi:predicted AlkP superfamily phosphohydrolase/phosphomutase